jgi:hypothetical protein
VIDEVHRRRDRVVARTLAYQGVHLLAHAPVGRVALRRRAKLQEMHRLACVHVHVEPHPVGHRDGVRRRVFQPR